MKSIDDYPVTPMVKRITLFSGGTAFLDGFNMIVASIALVLMGDDVSFTAAEMGLYASIYLVGVFIAAFVGGKMGDKFGRTGIYKIAPLAVACVSLLMLFINIPVALIVGRFLTGVCIGADYPMANSLVSEYSPKAYRGKGLVILMMAWYVGALAGSFVGFALYNVENSWAVLLASTAVPALLVFIGRLAVPESSRWLASRGRVEEAEKGLKKVFGEQASVADLGPAESGAAPAKVSLMAVFKQGYFKRFFFVAVFWTCQCIPVTAIFMFGPTIMQTFGLGEGSLSVLGTALIYFFFMMGVAPAIRSIQNMSRRKTLIITYAIMSAALVLLGLFSSASPMLILACFVVYSLAYGLQSVLDNTYPPELFPTEIRATAVGSLTSIAKIGGAIAAQLFPIGLALWGLGPVVLIGAGVSFLGLFVSVALAPETKGKTLEEASRLDYA